MEVLSFLLAPFIMCTLLVGIHCYLGLHVLARGIIFIDLALAQVAALGAVLALLLGYDHHDHMTYFISLSSTLIASLFLSHANKFKKVLSQEALIGVVYALASAVIILLIDKMSHGAEHLKQSLVGNLLWVTWVDVVKVFIVYSVVGLIHYVYRKKFIQNSFKGTSTWVWDFLFYGLFGVVITSSVHYAGVLLVFSFLIVPAVISSILVKTIRKRLLFGWIFGSLMSLIGMFISYHMDLPSGAAIILVFCSCPILLIVFGGHKLKKISGD